MKRGQGESALSWGAKWDKISQGSIISALLCVCFAGASAATPSTASGPRQSRAHPPLPYVSSGEWIKTDDYPIASAKREEMGVTAIRATVDTEGFVQECAITQSSGSVLLDDTTCAIIRARAWFLPATNESGTPIIGQWTTRVVWRLPGTPDAHQNPEEATQLAEAAAVEQRMERFQQNFESFSSETAFTVHEDGRVSDCEQRFVGAMAAQFAPFRCTSMPPVGAPFKNADGVPTSKRIIMRYSIELDDPGATQDAPPPGR